MYNPDESWQFQEEGRGGASNGKLPARVARGALPIRPDPRQWAPMNVTASGNISSAPFAAESTSNIIPDSTWATSNYTWSDPQRSSQASIAAQVHGGYRGGVNSSAGTFPPTAPRAFTANPSTNSDHLNPSQYSQSTPPSTAPPGQPHDGPSHRRGQQPGRNSEQRLSGPPTQPQVDQGKWQRRRSSLSYKKWQEDGQPPHPRSREIHGSAEPAAAHPGSSVPLRSKVVYEDAAKGGSSASPTAAVDSPSHGQDASNPLTEDYKMRSSRFFIVGRVFHAVFSEVGLKSDDDQSMVWTVTSLGEWIYTKTRRFVVVRALNRKCVALMITSHGQRGASNMGTEKCNYGLIYTGKTLPRCLPGEESTATTPGLQPIPLRVDVDDLTIKLDPTSRINYAHPYVIDHRYRVKNVGKINPRSMAALQEQWLKVSAGKQTRPSLAPTTPLFKPTEIDEQVYSTLVSGGWSHQDAANYINGRARLAAAVRSRELAREDKDASDVSDSSDVAVLSGRE